MVSVKFLTQLALATVAVMAADQPAGGSNDNPIITPSWGNVGNAGDKMQITWKPTTSGKVNLILRGGDQNNLDTIATIASGIDNSGKYEWTIPTDAQRQTSYSIEIQDADNKDISNYSPYFTILSADEKVSSAAASVASSGASSNAESKTGSAATSGATSGASSASKAAQTTSGSASSAAASSASSGSASASSSAASSASSSASSSGNGTASSTSASSTQSTGAAAIQTGGLLMVAAGLGAAALL